jgi:hypothetical protein
MSTGLSRYPLELVDSHAEALRDRFYVLMEDDLFIQAITYGTNHAKRVMQRFNAARAAFKEVFGDHSA